MMLHQSLPSRRRGWAGALAQLGIEHIPAFSPEARGRSERAFRTLQDRPPKKLAVPGMTTITAADRYLREVFVPAYNARFAVPPEQPGSAFVAIGGLDPDQVLCLEEPRQVANDNTVIWRCRRLQIPASPRRPHFVRARVKVRQHLDGSLSIFHGPRCIARYGRGVRSLYEPDILIRCLHALRREAWAGDRGRVAWICVLRLSKLLCLAASAANLQRSFSDELYCNVAPAHARAQRPSLLGEKLLF